MADLPDIPAPTIEPPAEGLELRHRARPQPRPHAAPGEVVLETFDLTRFYGRRCVVDSLNLTVRAGDIYGFLGPNGAGKSTTIRMLLGLIKPTAGSASMMGHDVRRHPRRALMGVGAQVEAPAFYRHLSGLHNLRILAEMTGRVSDDEIDQALHRVRLAGRERDRVNTYSQGMRARLALAAAMLPMPRLLILDEPTNGLDPQGMKEVRELIQSLAFEDGLTIFISSHLLHEIQVLCTKVAIIDRGKLVQAGAVEGLLAEPDVARVQVVCQPRELAVELVGAMSGSVNVATTPGGIEVELPRERIPELSRVLVGGGVELFELVPERMSLEDYFLTVTRGGLA